MKRLTCVIAVLSVFLPLQVYAQKKPAKVILTEGLYVLNKEVRDIMDVKVYVFTPIEVIKERWYKRAVSRGKTGEAAANNNSGKTKPQPKPFSDIPLLEDHQSKKSEPQTAEESSVDDFDSVFGHYHFVKDQIIQDLPYNSMEPSRYQGLMSDAEIKLSQEKIKTLHK